MCKTAVVMTSINAYNEVMKIFQYQVKKKYLSGRLRRAQMLLVALRCDHLGRCCRPYGAIPNLYADRIDCNILQCCTHYMFHWQRAHSSNKSQMKQSQGSRYNDISLNIICCIHKKSFASLNFCIHNKNFERYD